MAPNPCHRDSLGESPGINSSVQWGPGTCSRCAAEESWQEGSHSDTDCFWRWRPETQAQSALLGTQEPDKVGAAKETEENFTFNLTILSTH